MDKKHSRDRDWLEQAKDDLKFARYAISGNFYSQACFISQQAGEKAMKALALHLGADKIRGHSLKDLSIAMGINGDFLTAAKTLDLYYISARYPDSFFSGFPSEYFSEEQAKQAVDFAQQIINRADVEINS